MEDMVVDVMWWSRCLKYKVNGCLMMFLDGDFQYIFYLFISMFVNLDCYKIVLVFNFLCWKELMMGLGVDYVVKILLDVDEFYFDML